MYKRQIVNLAPNPHQPFVGLSAFAHKAGIHTSAIARAPSAYSHIDPESVGNTTRFLLSEMSGRSTVALKAEQMGIELTDEEVGYVVSQLKDLEHAGYHFEVADGSLELLMRAATGWKQSFFRLESNRVVTDQREDGSFLTEARLKLYVGDERIMEVAEGNGPVNALDAALRKALGPRHPEIARIHLTDFKVRVLDSATGTASVTRVLIDSTNGERTWTTIGVSDNVIEASWQALSDSIVFGPVSYTHLPSASARSFRWLPVPAVPAPYRHRPSPVGPRLSPLWPEGGPVRFRSRGGRPRRR